MSTRHWHAEVDEPWLELLRPSVTEADYVAQLLRVYGFIAPFESAYKYTPGVDRLDAFQQTSRAGLIAQDLLAVGFAPAQISTVPQCHSITTFRDVPESLGWLYVVERSTLLQDGIRRHLLRHKPELAHACTYLRVFDGRVSEHWTRLGQTLDRVGAKPEIATEIVASAHEAFSCVKRWFRTSGYRTRRNAG